MSDNKPVTEGPKVINFYSIYFLFYLLFII